MLTGSHCAQKSICSSHAPPKNDGRRISVSWGTPAVPIPLDVIGIDMHSTHNHSLTSQTIQDSLGSKIEDRELHDKQDELV